MEAVDVASADALASAVAATIVDIRTISERRKGEAIAGSIHWPWDRAKGAFDPPLDELPADKATALVLYCNSGRRVKPAMAALAQFGFSNVLNGKSAVYLAEAGVGTLVPSKIIVRQLFDRESCTYSYLLVDSLSSEAILIDPVLELADRDAEVMRRMGVRLTQILNTHVHADHVTGSGKLRAMVAQSGSTATTVISKASGAMADVQVAPGDLVSFGCRSVRVLATPGHTPGCVSYVTDDASAVFTGDALLVGGCGRTDFQGGDPGVLYDSVWREILSLPDSTVVWPAHDYSGHTQSTVGEEKACNPRLTIGRSAFIELMEKRFDGSSYPGKIDLALPANMVCGVFQSGSFDDPQGPPIPHPAGFEWTPRTR